MFCERSQRIEAADRKDLIDYLRSSLSCCNQLSLGNSIIVGTNIEVMSMPSYMLAGWKTRIDPGDCSGDGD